MKTFNFLKSGKLMAIAILSSMTISSCSSDDEPAPEPSFPTQVIEQTVAAEKTAELKFNANYAWQLSSNKGWCKFVNGQFKETTMTGKEGAATVTVEVTADKQSFVNSDEAEITLTMNGVSKVIAKITRPNKEISTSLVIKDAEGNEYDATHPIVIKGSGLDEFHVVYTDIKAETKESNFQVGVKSNPDWISVENVEGVFKMTFNNDNASKLDSKYSFEAGKNGDITFSVKVSETESVDVTIPVAYEGLDAAVIGFEPSYNNGVIYVTEDATKFYRNNEMTGEQEFGSKLSTVITARNDEFHMLQLNVNKQHLMGMDVLSYDAYDMMGNDYQSDWLFATVNKDVVELEADPLTLTSGVTSRGTAIMLIPNAVWAELKEAEDLNFALFDVDLSMGFPMYYLKEKYQDYMWATVMQEIAQQAANVTLTGYYTTSVISDWSTVSASDLVAFDNSDYTMMDMGKGEMGEKWGAAFPATALAGGKSVLIKASELPEGQMFGVAWNPYEGKINVQTITFEGDTYVVLTGTSEFAVDGNYSLLSLMMGNPDMGEFTLEVGFDIWN